MNHHIDLTGAFTESSNRVPAENQKVDLTSNFTGSSKVAVAGTVKKLNLAT